MAKRKTKQTRRKKRPILYFELIGILLILIAIFSSGISTIGEGFIPHVLVTLLQWVFGFWYIGASLFLFCLGIFLMIKRKWPTFRSMRWYGFYLLSFSLLLFTHVQIFEPIVKENQGQSIFGLTWDYYDLYLAGEVSYSYIGSGMIGALFFALSYYLLSAAGAKVLAVFGTIISIILITERSISDDIKKINDKIKSFSSNIKQKRINKKLRLEETTINDTSIDLPLNEENIVDDHEYYQETEKDQLTDIAYETKQWNEELNDETDELEDFSLQDEDAKNEEYILPPLQLLDNPKPHSQSKDKAKIQSQVKKLERTFESFGVKARVTKVHVGPAVTKYEVNPDIGVKVSKIVNLHDDLALALAAKDIRIEAPIPGKSAIGIEVPNTEVATVSLREVMQNFMNHPSKLLFGLGRDITGEAITAELNKMPHLLIAGATGSGKSVCVNGIITSILLRAKPHEVKMMMIDPKKVELNVYNGIPHLLAPVVTDPKKASQALKKVVSEMERRYDLFSDTGTRNIEGYNEHITRLNEKNGENHPHLPYIVVLIDELADLMMVASSAVEDSITRLAQMARAAGIHLIIATQRPSVDVITGVIKANIPSRIAFSVSSQTDSRTILDGGGAEKLLGKGDMLFLPVGASKPIRIQGAFLSDEEVERIVNHCIEQQKANYQEEMIPDETNEVMSEVDDDLYDEAVQLVIDMQSASVSMLQRRFRIGYTRAARLIDAMEERGIVGPYEGSKPRKVLIAKQDEEHTS